jgi:hypothetical protein
VQLLTEIVAAVKFDCGLEPALAEASERPRKARRASKEYGTMACHPTGRASS